MVRKNKKQTRNPPERKKLRVIPFPRMLRRGIANATQRYQAEIKTMVEEAVLDLQIKGNYRIDLMGQRFIEMSEAEAAAQTPAPPAPPEGPDGPQ